MAQLSLLKESLQAQFNDKIESCVIANNQITVTVPVRFAHHVLLELRDSAPFCCEQLIDVCAMDYLAYGISEWETNRATCTGFERGVNQEAKVNHQWDKPRFAVVYHLLSVTENHRLRVKVFCEGEPPQVDSVVDIWPSANWFEREAFDLVGILFNNHPDLRRILTDYGFIGHPFRKDFPLIGNVEVRYDATEGRVVYEPVSIESRTLVPKVIREDSRYVATPSKED